LHLLEQCYDGGTTRRLQALGVASGWRCLEVGAGGGSVAAFLCRETGRQGRVTAIDIDTRFIRDIDAPNLEVIEADVTTIEVPRDSFDLVHCRALLMHLADPEPVLDALVTALRPGGWLLVEEADHFPVSALGGGLHAEVVQRVLIDGLTAGGVDWSLARQLPARLQQRGLHDVRAEADVALFEGGSAMGEFLRVTVAQARAGGLTGGASGEQIDEWDRLVQGDGRWFHSFAMIGAWGRR
jgi:SAM-dependent methyltransferase